MNDLSAAAPGMVKQAIQVIKVTHILQMYIFLDGCIVALFTQLVFLAVYQHSAETS